MFGRQEPNRRSDEKSPRRAETLDTRPVGKRPPSVSEGFQREEKWYPMLMSTHGGAVRRRPTGLWT